MRRATVFFFATPAIIVAAAFTASACRSANNERKLVAVPQDRGELTIPGAIHGDAPLALVGKDLVANYGGSVLLWDAGVTADQIAAISTASVDGRLAKSSFAQFRVETVQPLDAELASVTAAAADNDQAINIAIANNQNSAEARFLQRQLSSQWFDGRLDGLVKAHALDAAGAASARDNFKGYCEYKLYELAVSRLLQLEYAERPTPLTMCEDYYVNDRQMFGAAESCQPAAARGAAKANYFDCIWNEGVVKSATFAALKAANPDGAACDVSGKRRAEALQAWLASGLLKKVLSDNDLKPIDNKSYADIFAAEVMTPTGAKLPQIARKKEGAVAVYADLLTCKQALIRADLTAPPPAAAPWANASLKDLKFIAEVIGDDGAALTLFPGGQDASAAAAAARQGVVSKLRLYAERNSGAVSAAGAVVIPNVLVSVDDHYFNAPIGQSIDANLSNVEQVKEEPVFFEIFNLGRKLAPKTLLDAESRLANEKIALLQELGEKKPIADGLFQAVLAANKEAIPALTAPGALVLARKMSLLIRTKEGAGSSGQIEATITIGNGRASRGCLDLAAGMVACDDADFGPSPTDSVPFTGMSYDAEAGKLVLTVSIGGDVEALGLAPTARTPDVPDFNDLATDQLAGRLLDFEIYPNAIGPDFLFVSGAVRLKAADGTVQREGAFSADDFHQ